MLSCNAKRRVFSDVPQGGVWQHYGKLIDPKAPEIRKPRKEKKEKENAKPGAKNQENTTCHKTTGITTRTGQKHTSTKPTKKRANEDGEILSSPHKKSCNPSTKIEGTETSQQQESWTERKADRLGIFRNINCAHIS